MLQKSLTNLSKVTKSLAKPQQVLLVQAPKKSFATSNDNSPTKVKKGFSTTAESAITPVSNERGYEVDFKEAREEYLRLKTSDCIDGCVAAAYVAYACSEMAFIYPITPSTVIGEYLDEWYSQGKLNAWGYPCQVGMMQSEAGAVGSVHGSIAGGSLTTTTTSSQGLLLKIPNMFLIAGELMPSVFHIAARAITKQSLSIHGDHSDVMAARQTGFAMMFSSTVQQVIDIGLACHIATIRSRVPMMHIFDGFRITHQINKIDYIPNETIARLMPLDLAKKNLRNFSLTPHNPIMRGTSQRPEVYFQAAVAAQKYFNECPRIVQESLDEVSRITGRVNKIVNYYGPEDATSIMVIMGSAANTVEETVDVMNKDMGYNCGSLEVKLYRPFPEEAFIDAIPATCKNIVVMDRTREDGTNQPLMLDVVTTLNSRMEDRKFRIVGGQFGLSSKEFTPNMVKGCFDNLTSENPKRNFCVGINDDITGTSIEYDEPFNTVPEGTVQCIFWGLGSDGTIGANKAAINTIGMNTDKIVQGYFTYDAFKTDGTTLSYLRFGNEQIKSEYEIFTGCEYIAVHKDLYMQKYDTKIMKPLAEGGNFVLNSRWNSVEKWEKNVPNHVLREIAEKNAVIYNIDAAKIAQRVGLGKRINNIMQACFYHISGVLPREEAVGLLKNDIHKLYGGKGEHIVKMNVDGVDLAIENLQKLEYNREKWLGLGDIVKATPKFMEDADDFVTTVHQPMMKWDGDRLPVSAFEPGGYIHSVGTTKYERRGVAPKVPVWIPDNCTQCNYCALVCPHAVIRPFLLDKKQYDEAPEGYQARKAKGGQEMAGLNYTIQVSTYDCTGCELCAESCPDDALIMTNMGDVVDETNQVGYWEYSFDLPNRENPLDKMTVKGSQFEVPLLEFSGACAGCGETPYVKLVTQLFGERMVIANATGCTMIWGSMFPSNPYTVKKESGRGPVYGHSLFEDAAEYGWGIVNSMDNRRDILKDKATKYVETAEDGPLKTSFASFVKNFSNANKCDVAFDEIKAIFAEMDESVIMADETLQYLYENKDLITKASYWFIGGDGWAYDIGAGGLDHCMAQSQKDFNVLIVDTEMYSNTGGQVSKATQMGSAIKFTLGGKKNFKKDLGMQAMTYNHVYVASIAIGANYQQSIQAIREAESYDGPSIVIAMAPCIDWGMKNMNEVMDVQKNAVESGYWPLYRFDPRKEIPFQLDSKKLKKDVEVYLDQQFRFRKLKRTAPEVASHLRKNLKEYILKKQETYTKLARDDYETLEFLKKKLGEESTSEKSLVLYGSETGNAQDLAMNLTSELKKRGVRAACSAMDDYDFDELPNEKKVYMLVATSGQGEYPPNCQTFMHAIQDPNLPKDLLAGVEFCTFGLGDSSYVYFNKAAKDADAAFANLGATRIVEAGYGDDKDEEKFLSVYDEWAPNMFNEAGLPAPPDVLLPPNYALKFVDGDATEDRYLPKTFQWVNMNENTRITADGYNRDTRHYEFDLTGTGMEYDVGDVLATYPHNQVADVDAFLESIKLDGNQVLDIERLSENVNEVPTNLTWRTLFAEVLDVFGRPGRRFYEFLSICATDEAEKADLKHLLTKEGKADLKKYVAETATYADLLQTFPSALPALEYLVEYIPQIKPRLYSIASANSYVGDKIQLCIVLDDWNTPSGKYRSGLNSTFLSKQAANTKIAAKLNKGGCNMPTAKDWVWSVGMGTGVAPIRAMFQDRLISKQQGKELGKGCMVFGNRTKADEFYYQDEIEMWQEENVLNDLLTAFSRDQAHKIYVQHRMQENPEMVYEYLYKNKGFFYLCGTAGSSIDACKSAVVDAGMQVGSLSREEAENWLTQMQIEGRWNIDVW